METLATVLAVALALAAILAFGGAVLMLTLGWVFASFGLLAPLGFFDSTIGFVLLTTLTSLLFISGGE